MQLFEYTDYRAYLRDFYRQQKSVNPSYSYRVFANKAKLGSPNYLKLVIDGQRRITDTNLPSFVRGLSLSKHESDYFRSLVLYAECKDIEAKNNYLKDILKLRARNLNSVHEVQTARIEMLKHWYHWAIRELTLLKDFSEDPSWIAQRLRHRITPKQAAASLELLEKLEFIKRDGGRFVPSEPLITTSDEISSLLIRDLHRQFMELGINSVFNDAIEQREVSALTIALPKSKIPEFKKSLKEFRKELNRLYSAKEGNEEVYHLVMNFFPLTMMKEGGAT
ncbi:MAG: TIGR02147 family protein [Bacteriovoracia bacterium]